MSAARRPDAIVVGAGIVGAACALELARAGLRVQVLEQHFVAAGTTGAGMGHVVAMDDSEAQLALSAWSRRLWEELAPELPRECEDDPCGTLWLCADEHELARAHARATRYREHGVAAEVLDAAELARAEPRLRPDLAGALFVPGDRVLYPPAAARRLLALAVELGSELCQSREVHALDARAVVCDGGRLEADVIVNAAGASAARLTPELPVVPRRGHLVITEREPGFCRHQLVESGYLQSAHGADGASVAFNVQPRATGQLLIGSSREFVGFDARPDPEVCARMLRRAVEFLPGLAHLQALRTWVGFRPATPDKLPFIGRHAPVEGLWVAAGHEGLGITTALGTARLLADLIVGRTPAIDPRPYAPDRIAPAGAPAAHPHASEPTASRDAARASSSHRAPYRRSHAQPTADAGRVAPETVPATPALDVERPAVGASGATSVAAALWNTGVAALRVSVSGQPRGPLCAMGVCFECRVDLDGRMHRRACLEPCRPGAHLNSAAPGEPGGVVRGPAESPRVGVTVDVAVVGAGPAGIAAAACAAETGARVLLLDPGRSPGGQIWRHPDGATLPRSARRWLARLERSGARVMPAAEVIDARPGALTAVCDGRALDVRAARLVVATGARELFLPFPGWTLPNVIGVGAAQALVKSGAAWRGRRVVVAGSGPLLLPVAATLRRAGARLVLVAEQAPLVTLARFGAGLWRQPHKWAEALAYRARTLGVPFRFGCHVAAARGDDVVREALLSDGRRTWSEPCDVLACAFGLVPNTELGRLLGCALTPDGAVAVDGQQRTSVPDVFAAGEVTGVAGAEAALLEGEIAGSAAAEAPSRRGLLRRRDRGRRFAAALAHAFAPHPSLRGLPGDDTLVCRCEDVPWGRVRLCGSAREAKLATRAGMGACQGRVCGAALRFLCGFEPDSVRAPLLPASIGALAGERVTHT